MSTSINYELGCTFREWHNSRFIALRDLNHCNILYDLHQSPLQTRNEKKSPHRVKLAGTYVLSPGARFFFSSMPKYDQSLCRVEMPHAFRGTQSQGYELEISSAKPLKLEGTYFTGFMGLKLCSLGSLSIRQSG
jgi:hypothetical protein